VHFRGRIGPIAVGVPIAVKRPIARTFIIGTAKAAHAGGCPHGVVHLDLEPTLLSVQHGRRPQRALRILPLPFDRHTARPPWIVRHHSLIERSARASPPRSIGIRAKHITSPFSFRWERATLLGGPPTLVILSSTKW
jgi:hypothetical protein